MKIFELLSVERIIMLQSTDKDNALRELCANLSKAPTVKIYEELENAIFEREGIISTSIGLGIAIPHVRLKSISKMTIAIGISKKGIDYKAFDDLPVHIIIMIAAPAGSHREYLSLLAKIALLLKNESIRKGILKAEKAEDVYEILRNH